MAADPTVSIERGRLDPHSDAIRLLTEAAAQTAAKHVPLSDVRIEIQDNPSVVVPELGLGGFAPDGYLIRISVDPHAPQLSEKLQDNLPRVLTHEWHHCARWRGPGYGTTLGEALVTEGLADHFDLQVHGEEPYGWATALTDEQAAYWWRETQGVLWHEGYDHAHWFFNRNRAGPPFQAGYALGFRIAAAYLDTNPGTTAADLVHTPAELIISGAAGTKLQSARQ